MVIVVDGIKGTPVPKREFLHSEGENSNNSSSTSVLPSRVPIVGLGCSSFSTFFWTKDELEGETRDDEEGDDKPSNGISNSATAAATAAPAPTADITAETLKRDHPRVKEWIETIRYAIEQCGISLLDTAPWYGHGTSEMVVGWALEDVLSCSSRPDDNDEEGRRMVVQRKDLCINTKVGRYEADPTQQFDFSRNATLASAKRSLERLSPHCQYIDVLQLHDPEFSPTLSVLLNETIPAMVECRAQGWCKALGLTGYPLEVQYQILQESLERYGSGTAVRIWDQSLTYGHFNLHDSSLVHRRVDGGCASFAACCHQHGMGVLAAAPLSMGLLTKNLPPDWHPANGSDLAAACREAAKICSDFGVDVATLALLYSMSHPSLPCTILGMKNVQQVKDAAELAWRFQGVDWTIPELTQDVVLSCVLSASEYKAYSILSDKERSPFASVWKRNTSDDDDGDAGVCAPKFQWDGIREAHEFWRNANAAEGAGAASFEEWQAKSFR